MVSTRAMGVSMAAAAALCVASGSASAVIIGDPITINFTSGLGPASFVVTPGMMNYIGNDADYTLPGSVPIMSGPNQIASLDYLNVYFIEEPASLHGLPNYSIYMDFDITAASVNIAVSITSGLMAFAPFLPSFDYAGPGMTLTDGTPGGDGAQVIGGLPLGSTYEARVNGGVYADLMPGLAVGPGDSNFTGDYASVGLGGPVSSMQVAWEFLLTADDLVSANSGYTIVPVIPTPGALTLLGLGGLVASRRRRA